jgi:hypothetical protein
MMSLGSQGLLLRNKSNPSTASSPSPNIPTNEDQMLPRTRQSKLSTSTGWRLQRHSRLSQTKKFEETSSSLDIQTESRASASALPFPCSSSQMETANTFSYSISRCSLLSSHTTSESGGTDRKRLQRKESWSTVPVPFSRPSRKILTLEELSRLSVAATSSMSFLRARKQSLAFQESSNGFLRQET